MIERNLTVWTKIENQNNPKVMNLLETLKHFGFNEPLSGF